MNTIVEKGLIAISVLALTFAFGRYSVKQVASKDVLKNTIMDSTIEKAKDVHTVTTVTTTVNPKTHAQVTTTVTDTEADTHTDIQTNTKTDIKTDIKYTSQPRTNISGLVGIDFRTSKPVYGGSATRQILGPISVGVWGLSNASGGVSIGVSF